jgi:hypothetical protein
MSWWGPMKGGFRATWPEQILEERILDEEKTRRIMRKLHDAHAII